MKNKDDIEVGDTVSYYKLKGTVTGFNGNKVLVRFSFMKTEMTFDLEKVKLIKKAHHPYSKPQEEVPQDTSGEIPRTYAFPEMMISLEALRFGLAPRAHIKELTIGYDELESWTHQYLPHKKDNGLKISKIRGDFGEGKSHSLQVIRDIAKEQGYLTSWIEVDGKNITFSRPETILQQIWSNLEGKDLITTTKLLDLHLKALERYGASVLNEKLKYFPRLANVNYAIRKIKNLDILDEYGHRIDCLLSSIPEETASSLKKEVSKEHYSLKFIKIPPMIGLKVNSRPYDFLETIVGNTYLSQLAGYNGLIITVDEFEVENYCASRGSNNNSTRIKNLLNMLDKYANNMTSYPKAPLSIFIASVDESDNLGISSIAKSSHGGSKELKKMNKHDLRLLGEKIIDFYYRSNGIEQEIDTCIIDEVEDSFEEHHVLSTGYTRAYIKQLMYLLDYYHGPRGA